LKKNKKRIYKRANKNTKEKRRGQEIIIVTIAVGTLVVIVSICFYCFG